MRHAVRRLARSPGFAVVAILSLALGLGAGTAAFSVLDAVRLRALPFRDGDRLVVISQTSGGPGSQAACQGGCNVSYEIFANVLEVHPFRTVDEVAGFGSGGKALTRNGDPITVQGGVLSPNLFRMLGAEPAIGRVLTEEDDRLGAELTTVISHELWVNQFGEDPGIIGTTIKLSDSRYTVVGVMRPGFEFEAGNSFWLPAVPTLDPRTRPSIRSLTVIARLRPGFGVEQLRSELAALDPALLTSAGRGNEPVRLDALPLRDRYTASTASHDLIFAAVVLCIVLIAGANLANMVLVRSLHQGREFAVRAALGAGRGRLTRHLLAEQAVIVSTAMLIGLGFAAWLLGILETVDVLQSLRPPGMEYRIDARAVGFAAILAALFAVGLSILPARAATRADLQTVLRQGGSQLAGGSNRAQKIFVIAQVATAVVLATGAGLMAKTVYRLARLDLGFDPTRVLVGSPSFPHDWRVKERYLPVTSRIVAELAQVPGVAMVGVRAAAPLGGSPRITLESDPNPLPSAVAPRAGIAVDTGYFRAVGVTMARGRDFGPQDTELAPPVVIVNEWAARRWWSGQDPIGKSIRIDTAPGAGARYEVVGVVRDNRAAQPNLLLATDGPELYRPLAQSPTPYPTMVVRSAGSTAPLVKPVREILARAVPDRPLTSATVSALADQQLAGVRVNALQILGFAVIGVLLALLGVYGVLSYTVGRRTREIGIRGALGAGTGAIRRMVLKDSAVMAGIGVVAGLPAAAIATRSLTNLLHGTNPNDPLVLTAVAAGIILAAIGAALVPARRAAKVDPLVALRED